MLEREEVLKLAKLSRLEVAEEDIERMIRVEVKSLSDRLAQYKRPTNIIISKDELPKTTTRKVKRKDVLELIKM